MMWSQPRWTTDASYVCYRWTRFALACEMMPLDRPALEKASFAVRQRLRAEADGQNAYLQEFADGRISLELEWIDLDALAEDTVAAYLGAIASGSAVSD